MEMRLEGQSLRMNTSCTTGTLTMTGHQHEHNGLWMETGGIVRSTIVSLAPSHVSPVASRSSPIEREEIVQGVSVNLRTPKNICTQQRPSSSADVTCLRLLCCSGSLRLGDSFHFHIALSPASPLHLLFTSTCLSVDIAWHHPDIWRWLSEIIILLKTSAMNYSCPTSL